VIKNILIAAAVKPLPGNTWEVLYERIQICAKAFNCVVLGGIVTHGPGCINMGLKIHGNNEKSIDVFAILLCRAMQPGKWGNTKDPIADGFICELEQ